MSERVPPSLASSLAAQIAAVASLSWSLGRGAAAARALELGADASEREEAASFLLIEACERLDAPLARMAVGKGARPGAPAQLALMEGRREHLEWVGGVRKTELPAPLSAKACPDEASARAAFAGILDAMLPAGLDFTARLDFEDRASAREMALSGPRDPRASKMMNALERAMCVEDMASFELLHSRGARLGASVDPAQSSPRGGVAWRALGAEASWPLARLIEGGWTPNFHTSFEFDSGAGWGVIDRALDCAKGAPSVEAGIRRAVERVKKISKNDSGFEIGSRDIQLVGDLFLSSQGVLRSKAHDSWKHLSGSTQKRAATQIFEAIEQGGWVLAPVAQSLRGGSWDKWGSALDARILARALPMATPSVPLGVRL